MPKHPFIKEIESIPTIAGKYLQSVQFLNDKSDKSWTSHTIKEYRARTETTREKIDKVRTADKIGRSLAYLTSETLDALYNAIGVYDVPDILDGNSHVWRKMTGDEINDNIIGMDWRDYLGDRNKILFGGGRIVVMLSPEGVKWLNGIADRVKQYIPSDVPTNKPTPTHREKSNMGLRNWLKQFDVIFKD